MVEITCERACWVTKLTRILYYTCAMGIMELYVYRPHNCIVVQDDELNIGVSVRSLQLSVGDVK